MQSLLVHGQIAGKRRSSDGRGSRIRWAGMRRASHGRRGNVLRPRMLLAVSRKDEANKVEKAEAADAFLRSVSITTCADWLQCRMADREKRATKTLGENMYRASRFGGE